jgi:L-histidine N-alpha-methyltransferase
LAATSAVYRPDFEQRAEFAADVCAGLLRPGQKELPSKYLYDNLGSALFEAICLLPEYGLHRAGARLMQRHASEIARRIRSVSMIAELGSGSGDITRWLLQAYTKHTPVDYFPIDISAHALARCEQELGSIEGVGFHPIELTYHEGLAAVAGKRISGQGLLALFLGSTIGNLDRPAVGRFLADVRRQLKHGDGFVLAADLEKPVPDLLAAYNDSIGVTAAFNLNVLSRLNRELGADFDLTRFSHDARWSAAQRRIEMHIVSRVAQRVSIPVANCAVEFRAGESIWTESCHKFSRAELAEITQRAGFRTEALWIDSEWPFAQLLLSAA